MFLFENPSYFRLHIISRKYSVCGRHALQQPISIWLVCISADTHCSPAYVSNSLMTADKGVALCIYKLHLLPYNQLSIRTLFVTSHAQNKKKKNGIDFPVILILCRAQQAFDWTLNTLMLYFFVVVGGGRSEMEFVLFTKLKQFAKTTQSNCRKEETSSLFSSQGNVFL